MFFVPILAQGISLVAMCLNVLSFMQKSKNRIIRMQLLGSGLFFTSYILLGATTGALLNVIGVFRATVYSKQEKFHAEDKRWIGVFTGLFLVVYALSFLLFRMPATLGNLLIELLPVASMVLSTVGFSLKSAALVRRLGFFYCPMWLTYNCFRFNLGGILCEIFSLVSIFIGYLRHDRHKSAVENSVLR